VYRKWGKGELRLDFTKASVPVLANAGPSCYSCGGPLKVIVRGTKMTIVLVDKRKFFL
jgi:hypothetical protein